MRTANGSSNPLAESHLRIGLLGVVAIIGLYNSLFAFSFLPLTEGWFSAYAHLILDGKVPYRDFYLYLTPLFPLMLAAITWLLGDTFFVLRLIGVIMVVTIAALLYLILSRRFSSSSSMIASIVACIYYQSGVAHIPYDFTQVLAVFSLATIWMLVLASSSDSVQAELNDNPTWTLAAPVVRHITLAGLFAALAFLTKQSNGALVFVAAGLSCAYIAIPYRSGGWALTLFFLGGALMPVVLMLSWLAWTESLPAFLEQILGGALAAKGSLRVALFSWIDGFLSHVYLMQIITVGGLAALVFVASTLLSKLFPRDDEHSSSGSRDEVLIGIYLALCLVAIATTYFAQPPYLVLHIALSVNTYIIPTLTVCSALLLALGLLGFFVPAIRRSPSPPMIVIGIMSAGMIMGNGTSGGLSEIGVFAMFALALAGLIDLPPFRWVGSAVAVVLSVCFVCFLGTNKFDAPYSWWGIVEPSVYEANHSSKSSIALGLNVSEKTAATLAELTNSLANGPKDGDIFAFPNIPVVYLIANRWPDSKVIVPWFDFLPDEPARAEAARLRGSPPAIIVNLKLPPKVWSEHERLFRRGKPLGQREIQNVIIELTQKRLLYRLDMSREISPNCLLEVWHKIAP